MSSPFLPPRRTRDERRARPRLRSRASVVEDLAGSADRVLETDAAWVLFASDRVFKVLKPQPPQGADLSTDALRRAACEAEVWMGRRLAPGAYLGVRPVTRDDTGRHSLDGPGRPVDWAVEMRRLPRERRADVLLAAGVRGARDVEDVAVALASRHATAPRRPARYASAKALRGLVRQPVQARSWVAALLDPPERRELERALLEIIDAARSVLAERASGSCVRDLHGDLRLRRVYLPGAGEPDPILFVGAGGASAGSRSGDVCSDVATLSADLRLRGHGELAERFVARYARAADDYDLYRVLDLHELVQLYLCNKRRGWSPSPSPRGALAEALRARLLGAPSAPARPPALILVTGARLVSRSAVAASLGARLASPVLDLDDLRGAAVGGARRVLGHAEALRRARAVLSSRRSVILVGRFSAEWRDGARELATAVGSGFLQVRAEPPGAGGSPGHPAWDVVQLPAELPAAAFVSQALARLRGSAERPA